MYLLLTWDVILSQKSCKGCVWSINWSCISTFVVCFHYVLNVLEVSFIFVRFLLVKLLCFRLFVVNSWNISFSILSWRRMNRSLRASVFSTTSSVFIISIRLAMLKRTSQLMNPVLSNSWSCVFSMSCSFKSCNWFFVLCNVNVKPRQRWLF